MSNTNEMEIGLDAEGQAVLDELEKEGHEIAGRAPVEPTPQEPVQPIEPKPVEPIAPKVPAPVEPVIQKEPPKPIERKVQHVPLPKYLETEKQLKEANAKIEELTKNGAKPSEQNIDQAVDAVKKLVDDFGYDEEEAKKLANVIKAITPNQSLTPEQQQALADLNTLRQQLSTREEALKNEQEKIGFENDFTEKVLKDFPHLAEHKQTIKEMAYSDQYAKTPLRAVALAFMDAEGITPNVPDVINGDKPGGGTGRQADTVDFNNLTEDQFNKLSPEQQDQFFAFQDSKERQGRGALNPLK